MRGYKDYYFGYEDADGKYHPGYQDMIEELTTKFPLTEERITGEQRQKEFIVLFGAILRMRNLLTSFDEFAGSEILSERDFQDYLGRYQDLRDEWKNRKPVAKKRTSRTILSLRSSSSNKSRSISTTSCFWYRNTTIHTAMTRKCLSRSAKQWMPVLNCAARRH